MKSDLNKNLLPNAQNQKLRVLICGHTGATGKALLSLLLESPHCELVVAIGRRENIEHKNNPKLKQIIVPNMLEITSLPPEVAEGCNTAFCCIGTPFNDVLKTLFSTSKSQNYQNVDFGIATAFAKFAKSSGVELIATITGDQSNSKSRIGMTRVKGETEDFIQALGFSKVAFLRPGLLQRGKDAGWLERILSLGGLLGLPVADLAKAMLWIALNQTEAVKGYESTDINKVIKAYTQN